MNIKKLLKELGLKTDLKVRDLIMFRMDEDRKDKREINDYVFTEYGDTVAMITFYRPKKKGKRARLKKGYTKPKWTVENPKKL